MFAVNVKKIQEREYELREIFYKKEKPFSFAETKGLKMDFSNKKIKDG